MNKDSDGKITKNPEGSDKAFKGSGVEGQKSAELTSAEKKALEKAEAEEREARQRALRKRLGKLRAEDKRLLADEEKAGYVDGHMVVARADRKKAIENCEAELKGLGTKR